MQRAVAAEGGIVRGVKGGELRSERLRGAPDVGHPRGVAQDGVEARVITLKHVLERAGPRQPVVVGAAGRRRTARADGAEQRVARAQPSAELVLLAEQRAQRLARDAHRDAVLVDAADDVRGDRAPGERQPLGSLHLGLGGFGCALGAALAAPGVEQHVAEIAGRRDQEGAGAHGGIAHAQREQRRAARLGQRRHERRQRALDQLHAQRPRRVVRAARPPPAAGREHPAPRVARRLARIEQALQAGLDGRSRGRCGEQRPKRMHAVFAETELALQSLAAHARWPAEHVGGTQPDAAAAQPARGAGQTRKRQAEQQLVQPTELAHHAVVARARSFAELAQRREQGPCHGAARGVSFEQREAALEPLEAKRPGLLQ